MQVKTINEVDFDLGTGHAESHPEFSDVLTAGGGTRDCRRAKCLVAQ